LALSNFRVFQQYQSVADISNFIIELSRHLKAGIWCVHFDRILEKAGICPQFYSIDLFDQVKVVVTPGSA